MGLRLKVTRKWIISYLILILLIGLGILTALRWNAWFSNKPELSYITPDSIDRITITPGSDFSSERHVSWRCGEVLSPSFLEYGLAGDDTVILQRRFVSAQGIDVASRSGHGCFYQARLSSLKPGSTYRYRLHTGNQISSSHLLYVPQVSDTVRFVYLGDVQDPDGSMSSKCLPQLPKLVERIDFLAFAGDQIEGPANQYWDVWYKSLGALGPNSTVIASTGNHEYLKKGFLRELDPRWVPQHGFPSNGPRGFEGRSYYVDFPLMRYIVMDSNGITDPLSLYRHRAWLSEVLQNSKQPWQILMFHHAIYSVRDGRMNPIMRYGFRDLIESEGVDLVLQGHDHAYSRINKRTSSGILTTPMYIISSSSPKVYRNGFDEIHDRLGSGLQLYQDIVVTENKIHYRCHKYDGSLYDDVEILKVIGNDSMKVLDQVRVIDHAIDIPEEFKFNAFSSNAKGRKKAEKYRQSIEKHNLRRKSSR